MASCSGSTSTSSSRTSVNPGSLIGLDLFECPICLRPFEDELLVNSCGHVYCKECVERYLDYPGNGPIKECPICKEPLSRKTLRKPSKEYELASRLSRVLTASRQDLPGLGRAPSDSYSDDNGSDSDPDVIHNLFVRTLTGKTINLHPDGGRNTTIKELKDLIHYNEGIRPEHQVLMWGGRILGGRTERENSKTLKDYGIGNENTIHLTTRLLGGGARWIPN